MDAHFSSYILYNYIVGSFMFQLCYKTGLFVDKRWGMAYDNTGKPVKSEESACECYSYVTNSEKLLQKFFGCSRIVTLSMTGGVSFAGYLNN